MALSWPDSEPEAASEADDGPEGPRLGLRPGRHAIDRPDLTAGFFGLCAGNLTEAELPLAVTSLALAVSLSLRSSRRFPHAPAD